MPLYQFMVTVRADSETEASDALAAQLAEPQPGAVGYDIEFSGSGFIVEDDDPTPAYQPGERKRRQNGGT